MVDDGSTDGSAAIAREFAARDERFKLLTQPNGGLSKARNTGIDAASGEYLAFLDSDDVLPPNAYELLLAALAESGSDFASGNVHRLTSWGATSQSKFLEEAFARTQLKTHVTRFRPLLADRTAWNKLFRRSFWDEHRFRFPEGVVHEDIPVTLPAHFKARSVDVVADPVYLYRIREDGELSITQRRLEPRVLLDRLAAVEQVDEYLAEHGPRRARALVPGERRRRRPALPPQPDRSGGPRLPAALPRPCQRVPGPRIGSRLRRPRGDRAPQVAPRPPPQAARDRRSAALRARGPADHAAGADRAEVVRRLSLSDRPRAARSRSPSTGSTPSCSCARRSRTCASRTAASWSAASRSSTALVRPSATRRS